MKKIRVNYTSKYVVRYLCVYTRMMMTLLLICEDADADDNDSATHLYANRNEPLAVCVIKQFYLHMFCVDASYSVYPMFPLALVTDDIFKDCVFAGCRRQRQTTRMWLQEDLNLYTLNKGRLNDTKPNAVRWRNGRDWIADNQGRQL